jgi:hypothetical protein
MTVVYEIFVVWCVFDLTSLHFTSLLFVVRLLLHVLQAATTAFFAGFVAVMYCGFPFTVFSQLTTGPMLDAIAPKDKVSRAAILLVVL